ncbi:MAG: TolC family protein [Opitutaceae bacterium]
MHNPRFIITILGLLLAGCASGSREEKVALDRVRQTGARLHPGPDRPALTTGASLADYLHYALLNHPQVEAAYDEWHAAALAIAPARALPDPKLTFQADIARSVTSLMPGLMFDVMAPGKRAAMAREAAAASEVAYRRYVTRMLETAAGVKKNWVDLTALEETLRLKRQMLSLKEEAIRFSHAEHVTMHAMGSLDQLTQLLNEAGRLRLEIANLEDERRALRAGFKAALGIAHDGPDPAWPECFAPPTAPTPDDDTFWRAVVAANPRLGEMRAMVEMSVAQVAVEQKARTPDFAAGLMADLKMNPVLWRPLAEMTLPVWRKKIAATIAAAQARHDAAVARLRTEELMVAADLARMTYMVREADRMVAYIDGTALPNLRQSYDTVAAAYGTGMTNFAMIPETQEMVLAMQVERVAALRDREKTLADLSLLVAGEVPAGAPLPARTAAATP